MPEFRSSGGFGNEEPELRWTQPSDVWQAMMVFHLGTFFLNGSPFDIEPFDLVIVPPGARCEVHRFGLETFVYNYFSFIPVPGERDIVSLPVRTPLGPEAGHFWDVEFRKALNRIQFSRTTVRVLAWHLLLSVAKPEHEVVKSVYTEQAERQIEERLGERIVVSQLCKDLDVSQSQLTRLFIAEHGRTPLQYILDRRAHRAHQLLTSTTLPIKQVAANCGIGDIHQFNRFVRARYGESPRSLRHTRGVVDIYRVSDLKRARGQD